MDPVRNPFAPGSGSRPPVLTGRKGLLDELTTAMRRVEQGRASQNFVLSGLRGVGKTVLLRAAQDIASHEKLKSLMFEADEGRTLRTQIDSRMRQLLLRLDASKKMSASVKKGLRVLASFSKAARIKHGDLELTLDLEPLVGTADSGNIEDDLPDLFEAVGEAAKARGTAIILIIDEIQFLEKDDLVALIGAMHRTSQLSLPLLLIGGGLPQVVGTMGAAKGYSERLFKRVNVNELPDDEARRAIVEPLKKEGAKISKNALDEIISATMCYPYFIQEWGKHAWNIARSETIDIRAAREAHPLATESLDDSFFRFRLDQLTDREKQYARAMAEFGPGPYKSGEVARSLGIAAQTLASTRNSLVKKGIIYSPIYGDTLFTVPLFHEFLCRVMTAPTKAKRKQAATKK